MNYQSPPALVVRGIVWERMADRVFRTLASCGEVPRFRTWAICPYEQFTGPTWPLRAEQPSGSHMGQVPSPSRR